MSLGEYLQKIREKITQRFGYKEVVVESVQSMFGIKIEADAVTRSYDAIKIQVPRILKAEILLKKGALIALLNERGVLTKDII